MIEAERPEHPAGHAAAAGGRRSPARRRARARRKARLRIGATAALAVIATGSTGIATGAMVIAGGGTAMAASSSPTTTPATTAPSAPPSSGTAPSTGNGGRTFTRPFSVSGVLKSVGKKSLAFKLADDTVATATLSSKTVYTKTENMKPSALKNGKRVTVTGTTTNGVLAASRIMVTSTSAVRAGGFGAGRGTTRPTLPAGSRPSVPANFRPRAGAGRGFGAGGNFAFGTISGLSGGSFTLTEFNQDKVKVTTSASTVITETVRTTKKGLKVGQELFIVGKEVNNTTVAAASVSQGTAGFGGFAFGGRGRAPGGGTGTAA